MKTVSILALNVFVYINTFCQEITGGVEIRPKTIIDNGYSVPKQKNEPAIAYITQRSKLFTAYKTEKTQTYISFQDVRFWGDEIINNNFNDATMGIDLAQAWVILMLTPKLSIKAGRQIFNYDDGRVIAARNWKDNQAMNDAVLIKYKNQAHELNISTSWNADNKSDLLYSSNKYKSFNFIWYQLKKANYTFSSMNILSSKTKNDTSALLNNMGTHGLYISFNHNNWETMASLYYQYNINNTNKQTQAFCYSYKLWYGVSNKTILHLGLGFNYISGNKAFNAVNTNHKFDLLMGTKHGYYGFMDYFTKLPDQGLQDFMLLCKINFATNLQLKSNLHIFWLAQRVSNPNSDNGLLFSKKLGKELDLFLNWEINHESTLQLGYAAYNLTNTLKTVKKCDNNVNNIQQWAYIMLTIKPEWNYKLKTTSVL